MQAVFLDRDGVLNRAEVREGRPYPPRSLNDLQILPGVREACQSLKDHGFLLIVVTNQPDVARGTQSRATVEAMHHYLLEKLPLDHIEVCYADGDNDPDRKPAPGMLLRLSAEWDIDLKSSYMVGDRWRDIDCGHAAGCTPIFVDRGYREHLRAQPAFRAGSLQEAANWIICRALREGWKYSLAATMEDR